MSTLPDFSRQYQPPKIPTHWSADERRFAQGVTDVLDDIYLRYGRLSKKDLSPALSKEILDASGNIVQLQLDTSGLTTRMLSAEGDISSLSQTVDGFETRVANAEGDISILEQTATSFGTRISNAEGDISTLEQTANSLTSRISGVEGVNSTQQTEINQNKLDITLKASETTVTALAGRVTTAESSISTQAGQIALKAEKTVTDGLNTRLTSAEEKITPNAITATVRSHANYQSDLNAKNRTFVGGTPTGMIAGDLWIDSENGNLLKRYSGSAWAAVQDGAISIAQQQADKIQWLVASGTSAANMTLTSQLYSLMAENIDLSANNSIKLAVSGGTNLVPYSVINTTSDAYGFEPRIVALKNSTTYTMSVRAKRNAPSAKLLTHIVNGSYNWSIDLYTETDDYSVQSITFTTAANVESYASTLYFYSWPGSNGGTVSVDWVKIEKGTMAQDWSPAPSDPASGVKTSYIDIATDHIDISSGGKLNLTSANDLMLGAQNITAFTDGRIDAKASTIDLSANNSIKLAVSGGTNLVPYSVINTTSDAYGFEPRIVALKNSTTYTMSVRAKRNAPSAKLLTHIVNGSYNWSIDLYTETDDYSVQSITFTTAANVESYASTLYFYSWPGSNGGTVSVDWVKIEKGTMAQDWSPAPSDPASGVKTSTVTIDTNGVAIATGGVFTVSSGNFGIDASGNVTMKGQVEATSGKIGGFTLSNGALTSTSGFFLDPTLSLPQMSIKYLNMGSASNGAYLMCTYDAGYSTFNIQNPYGAVDIIGGRSNQWGGSLTLSRDANGLKLAQISDKLQVSDTVYIENNCSALSFTDRTPAYTGNALDELRWVRGNRAQGIDHNSIPPFARKTIENTRTLPDGTVEHYREPGRDLGAMISILTKAVQEIDDRMNAFERRLPA